MFGLIYADETAAQHGAWVVKRPNIAAAAESIASTTEIPGRAYGLAERSGYYNDVEIPVELNYVANTADEWTSIYRDCSLWLRKTGTLKFTDDLAAFYRVRYVNIGQNERLIKRIGRFTATFVCQPGTYFENGQEWLEPGTQLYNYHSTSQPVYEITGNGECTLTVNGNTMKGTVDGSLTIDTDLWLAYKDKTQNTLVTGDYDGLYLNPGLNTIGITEDFKLRIKPNWRII